MSLLAKKEFVILTMRQQNFIAVLIEIQMFRSKKILHLEGRIEKLISRIHWDRAENKVLRTDVETERLRTEYHKERCAELRKEIRNINENQN